MITWWEQHGEICLGWADSQRVSVQEKGCLKEILVPRNSAKRWLGQPEPAPTNRHPAVQRWPPKQILSRKFPLLVDHRFRDDSLPTFERHLCQECRWPQQSRTTTSAKIPFRRWSTACAKCLTERIGSPKIPCYTSAPPGILGCTSVSTGTPQWTVVSARVP